MSEDVLANGGDDDAALEAQALRYHMLMAKLRASPYIPIEPTVKQWLFILDERREILFGGAAGSGKTLAQLASALLHVDKPNYRAIILRRTFPDLALPGAPMDIADQWLTGTDAKRKNQGKEWWFPSGAKLIFGYMATDQDRYRYMSSRFDYVGYDESSTFTEEQLRYLFSRMRQDKSTADSGIPLRYRLSSNPGGVSHTYLKDRYVFPLDPSDDRIFIPATMADNPHLDTAAYLGMLSELDPVTRAQLQHGDWLIQPSGNFFLPNFPILRVEDSKGNWGKHALRCRAWDLAATSTGDYCVGVKLAMDVRNHLWRVEDVVRVQAEPAEIEKVLEATAKKDGRNLPQVIEQEGGSAGKLSMRVLRTQVFLGSPVYPVPATGNKMSRARLPASIVAQGDMELAPGGWNTAFLDELVAFPEGKHDDIVDALSHGTHWLTKQAGGNRPRPTTRSIDSLADRPKRLKASHLQLIRPPIAP